MADNLSFAPACLRVNRSPKRRSQHRDSQHRPTSILRGVSFSRRKEEDEIPLVPLDQPAGQLDAISENEMAGFRGQILSFSELRRKSIADGTTPLVR